MYPHHPKRSRQDQLSNPMYFNQKEILDSKKVIEKLAPNFVAKVGLILGSGLGGLADSIENPVVIPYEKLPGFPVSTVAGHAGALVLGKLCGVSVACLRGRIHLYEGIAAQKIKILIRILKQLGCHKLFLTNAAGSLRKEVGPGELMLITDHINFQHTNPIIGPNDEEYGERFFAMDNAYDVDLREKLKKAAKSKNVSLHEGIYLAVLGPCFETPAEICAFRTLGAHAVGMSTVPEVIVARHCGLKVAAISVITNLSADMSEIALSHEQTLEYANRASEKLCTVVKTFLQQNAKEFSK